MSAELLSFLDGPDLYPPAFDSEFCWDEEFAADPVRDAPPATFGLALVPDPAAAIQTYSPVPDPPARTLREGVDAIAALVEEIDAIELDEELSTEEREAAVRILIENLLPILAGTKKKVDSTNAVLAMFEHLAASAKCERDRLAKRVRKYERNVERLESYVLATLTASKLDCLEGETSTLRKQLNPASVVFAQGMDFERDLDDEFLRWTSEPNKTAIKAAIKAKRAVPGASLVRLPRLVRS